MSIAGKRRRSEYSGPTIEEIYTIVDDRIHLHVPTLVDEHISENITPAVTSINTSINSINAELDATENHFTKDSLLVTLHDDASTFCIKGADNSSKFHVLDSDGLPLLNADTISNTLRVRNLETAGTSTSSVELGTGPKTNDTNNEYAISIGLSAGADDQQSYGIAIGRNAGEFSAGSNSISIGHKAGRYSLGSNSICIGKSAGEDACTANAIIVNASDTILDAPLPGFYVSPVSPMPAGSQSNLLLTYSTQTKEIAYFQRSYDFSTLTYYFTVSPFLPHIQFQPISVLLERTDKCISLQFPPFMGDTFMPSGPIITSSTLPSIYCPPTNIYSSFWYSEFETVKRGTVFLSHEGNFVLTPENGQWQMGSTLQIHTFLITYLLQ